MTDAPETKRLSRLVRQHAQASRLMGVDFIPVTGGIAANRPAAPAASAFVSAPDPLPATLPRRQPMAQPPPAAARTSPTTAPVQPAIVIEPKPIVTYTDPERIEAQKKLDEILARYEREAPHKHFVTDHHSIVFGEGDPRARMMFIGEAPGADEDKCGRPFVGRAGQLLNKMIEALGLKRQDVYIANILKTRPPNNATPTMDECSRCAPYLFDQIAAIKPEVIVTLGLPATRVMLNTMDSMGNLRGTWSSFPPPGVLAPNITPIPVMPTYHPAFLLRAYTKENRAKVWSDLQQAAKRLGLATPQRSSAAPG